MWFIWREHNNHTFEDVESFENQLLTSFISTLFDWSWVQGLTSSDSLPTYIDSSFLYIDFSVFINFLCTFWLFHAKSFINKIVLTYLEKKNSIQVNV